MKNNEAIISIVASVFGISAIELCSKERRREVSLAKSAYCGLMKNKIKFSTINVLLGISTPSAKKFIKQCDILLNTDTHFAELYRKAQENIALIKN